MAKRVGVLLSGCGFLDGAEIHEATLTLLALDRRGAAAIAIAPDLAQADVVDHQAHAPSRDGSRNALVEAARISRGHVRELSAVSAKELDALILPGGYGAAKTLSSFATDGPRMRVLGPLEALIRALFQAQKPMGFLCIAPVIAAKVLGESHPRLTIGDDAETAAAIEAMVGRHVRCKVDEVIVDPDLHLVSSPAYMLGPSIAPVAAGIDRLVAAVLDLSRA